MAQGEYIGGYCAGGTGYAAATFPAGYIISAEKCNLVTPTTTCMTVNDDYSLTVTITLPSTITCYPEAWYTCENWGNDSYPGIQTVPLPDISKVTLTINCEYVGVFQTITLTNPLDLVITANEWTYTTEPCKFNVDCQYTITSTMEFDYASSPVTANNWACYCNLVNQFSYSGRPWIGVTSCAANASTSYNSTGTVLPYDPAAGCTLLPTPRQKKGRRR